MHEFSFYCLCMNNFDLLIKTLIAKETKAYALTRNLAKLVIAVEPIL